MRSSSILLPVVIAATVIVALLWSAGSPAASEPRRPVVHAAAPRPSARSALLMPVHEKLVAEMKKEAERNVAAGAAAVTELAEAAAAVAHPPPRENDADRVVGVRFRSCPGWRLNGLPQVKRFLRGEAAEYPAVEIEWIRGMSPICDFLTINRRVVKSVDLAPLSTDAIRSLLASYGITKESPKPRYTSTA